MSSKLINAREPEKYRRLNIDWDDFLEAIPSGKMKVYDRDPHFENCFRSMLARRHKNGGRLDYYCFAEGSKFYIARR